MEDSADRPTLDIQLLGDFRLVYGGDLVTDVDTPRLQSLLAYLLLHRGSPQSRHRVAFLFWPDSTEGQALTNLRNLLYRLRHTLPDADRFIEVDRKTLQWRTQAPFLLDVARFEEALEAAEEPPDTQDRDQAATREALEEAVHLYRGDLLPSSYEDWVASERERLRQAFHRGAVRLVRLLEKHQDYRAAIRVVQRLVRYDPLHEGHYRRLMRLQALIGDRAGALRTYHKCIDVLDQELNVGPSPRTRELYDRLLALEESATPPRERLRRMADVPELVNREDAWTQLRRAWRSATRGHPHVVLISGEAGIGKTRLAEELVEWADRQGISTAVARCYDAPGELAYAPVAAWLRALPLPRLERVWRAEVARILPEITAEEPDVSPPGPLAESWQRRRFFEALARATLSAGQPLLLVIDALQWCDSDTLDWLHYLLNFDTRARLLIVGTHRPGEVEDGAVLDSLLHQLRHDERLTELDLAPLNKRETALLAENLADRKLDSALIDCLYRETEGNPLFIVETVRAGLPDQVRELSSGGFVCVPRPLPSRMKDALMARVEQLSPLARGLAELAAAIGREFTFDVLLQATSGGEESLVRGLDELWQHQIVREREGDVYDFTHDKLREVIYAELSEARRRMLHRHAARALEAVYAEDLDSVAARIADHCERAHERREAARYYRRAAEVAEKMQALEEAARYRQRASELEEESLHAE